MNLLSINHTLAVAQMHGRGASFSALVLFGAVIALTAALIALADWRKRWRAKQLQETARSLGLTYRPDAAELLGDGLSELPIFAFAAVIRSSRLSNIMTGTIAGTPLLACDYAYWTGSVKDQRFDYAQTVVCLRLEADQYPAFTVYPAAGHLRRTQTAIAAQSAGVLSALAQPLAKTDPRWAALTAAIKQPREAGIDLSGSPEFENTYRVTASHGNRIGQILRRDALNSLAQGKSRPLSLESSGRWLAIYSKDHLVAPAEMADFLRRCVELKKALFVA